MMKSFEALGFPRRLLIRWAADGSNKSDDKESRSELKYHRHLIHMQNIDIVRIEQLPLADLQPLLQEARQQGFEFLDRLVEEYLDGTNQFAQPGEALFGVYSGQRMIAIGGLNRDPYLQESDTGRVRHVYVLSAWRGQGVGKQLVQRIIDEARHHYRLLTLRTFTEPASKFYCTIGFQTEPEIPGATHHLVLKES